MVEASLLMQRMVIAVVRHYCVGSLKQPYLVKQKAPEQQLVRLVQDVANCSVKITVTVHRLCQSGTALSSSTKVIYWVLHHGNQWGHYHNRR